MIGAGKVRLSVEVELCGEKVVDLSKLKQDAERIANHGDAYKVLLKTSERMVRKTGRTINEIEAKIQSEFNEITIVDFEIN